MAERLHKKHGTSARRVRYISMENENRLNEGTAKEGKPAAAPDPDNKTASEVRPAASRAELPPLNFREDPGSGGKWLRRSAVVVLLALLGFGGYKYGRPMLEQHRDLLSSVPHLEESFAAVDQRVKAAEDKLQSLAADRDGFATRMAKLEKKVSLNLQSARKQTQELIAQAQQRMQAEMDRRSQAVDARLSSIESGQEAENLRLAKLQSELANAREQISSQSRQISVLQQETGRNMDQVGRHLARLDGENQQDRRNLDSVSAQVERKRIDFEASKNHLSELAPGVELEITHTDVANRRVDGWLWLLPDRRTVWVRRQSSQSPVVFYTKDDNRPRELVITHVTKNSVVGYLLGPARAARESLAYSPSPAGATEAARWAAIPKP